MLAALPTALFAAAYNLGQRPGKLAQFLGALIVTVIFIGLLLLKIWLWKISIPYVWRTVVVMAAVLALLTVVVIAHLTLQTAGRLASGSAPPAKAAPAVPSSAPRVGTN